MSFLVALDLNNCTSLIVNTSVVIANSSVSTFCTAGYGVNAVIGNGQFYIMTNISTRNSGLVCDGVVNEATAINNIKFTEFWSI